MKFVCEKNAILNEIAMAQEIVVSKNAISILSNIYLETAEQALIIKSSDIKLNFTTKVPVSVIKSGRITVKSDKFLKNIANMPDGEVEFELLDNKLIIKAAKTKINMTTIPVEQYPQFPDSDKVKFFELKIKDFKSMIKQTIFSVSDDETRFFMTGVYFEKLDNKIIMVSTDGRRLACIEQEIENDIPDFKSVIIPEKILNVLLKRSGDEGVINIGLSENNIFINFASYSFSSVLIEGQFPNYRKVIPEDNKYKSVLSKFELIDALKHVSPMVEEKTKRIYLKFNKDKVTVYTGETESGSASDELTCEFNDEEQIVALNYSFIEDICKVLTEEKISFMFKDTGKAITVKPEPESNYIHVIMPMSLD